VHFTPAHGLQSLSQNLSGSIGNVPAKQVIHAGSGELIKKVVKKTIEDGIDIVSPGCDFWIETPVEKIKIFVSAVEEYGKRQ